MKIAELDKIRIPAEQDRRRKLTEEQIEEACKLYAEGASQRAIARRLGVSQFAVGYHVSEVVRKNHAAYRKTHPQKKQKGCGCERVYQRNPKKKGGAERWDERSRLRKCRSKGGNI